MILQKINLGDPPYHYHDLWGVPTVVKGSPRNANNLLEDEIKD
jgi:hypothetical protein